MHPKQVLIKPEDAIIYEGHIRDFSILDMSTQSQYRGKYQAFTVSDSTPVQHLKRLGKVGDHIFKCYLLMTLRPLMNVVIVRWI